MNKWIGLAVIVLGIFLGFSLIHDINNKKEMVEGIDPLLATNGWYKYASPNGNFDTMFPNRPHHSHESKKDEIKQEIIDYDFFISTKEDGSLFSINLISFPNKKKIEDSTDFLMSFMKDMLNSNPKNVIKTLKIVPYQKLNAVDFTVEIGEASIDGKAFIKDNTICVLSATAKNDNKNKAEFDFFMNSFVWRQNSQTPQK